MPRAQHHDLVGHGHRFDLIVSHIDHGGLEPVVQLADFQPHAHTQRCVKVREGLIKQKRRRFAHDGAADGHALALTA